MPQIDTIPSENPPAGDTYTVKGLKGHWHRTLERPCGYQHFNWYQEGANPNGVYLNDPDGLRRALVVAEEDDLYLYTQHEVFDDTGVVKHTRSSPNWEGGVVTYSTCKHLMRCVKRDEGWVGVWLAGLAPRHCARNCLMFVGRVACEFHGNYWLREYIKTHHPAAAVVKRADTNPRGDLYTPIPALVTSNVLSIYDHENYLEPPNHTRSVEFYKKSPGSVSDRPDGKIPKWWRDVEYQTRGVRPPSFVLSPCWLFSRPVVWCGLNPRRASLRVTPARLAAALLRQPR